MSCESRAGDLAEEARGIPPRRREPGDVAVTSSPLSLRLMRRRDDGDASGVLWPEDERWTSLDAESRGVLSRDESRDDDTRPAISSSISPTNFKNRLAFT